MAAKWQQWMPFHIDRFKASPAVQSMPPTARIGYLYLLACCWQSDDCTIPGDDDSLAELSGLGEELWAIHKTKILRKFGRGPDDHLLNFVLLAEWKEAKRIFDKNHIPPEELSLKRSEAGRKGNMIRWDKSQTDRKCDESLSQTDRKPSHTGTGTITDTKEQKPVRTEARFTLPEWINKDAWAGFEEMRKRIRAPMTDRARAGIIKALHGLCMVGDDGAAILDQSTQSSYRGVFPLKETNGSHTNGNGRGFATKGEHNQRVLDDYIRSLEAEDSDGPEANGHDAGRDTRPGSTAALFGPPSKRAS